MLLFDACCRLSPVLAVLTSWLLSHSPDIVSMSYLLHGMTKFEPGKARVIPLSSLYDALVFSKSPGLSGNRFRIIEGGVVEFSAVVKHWRLWGGVVSVAIETFWRAWGIISVSVRSIL